MLQKLIARRRENEKGFTLIELMVVVLIIAILIAIAIPTFLGARARAQDRAAQSSLRNALTAAKTLYTDQNDYSTATAGSATTGLQSVEPSLTYRDSGNSTGPKDVSVAVSGTGSITWSAASLSKSGKCFWITDTATGPGTKFGSGANTACAGTDAAAAASDSW
jgi:type IV pilus assembly protein PilA